MTIWDLKKRTKAEITNLTSTLPTNLSMRLAEMGFIEGQIVHCMKRTPFSGPLVIQLQDCVYSIEKDLAQQVHVSPIQ
ncbi:ferrous iron transport protein A [Glaciecola sp. XM2]|jgi:ferrous iron transport protein A|uniref:FeoA family protein n=1 Tax=Glaciecola sp. XM2 TaxID=1914931 RepID=UPI001BDE05F1|nr:FeoA family protein [Glaciecola sp. XM2]MBT1451758.1 ferrous iron transport protein A [Glaciecola sp. XM2]